MATAKNRKGRAAKAQAMPAPTTPADLTVTEGDLGQPATDPAPYTDHFYGRNRDGSLVPKWDLETDQGEPEEPAEPPPDPAKVERLAKEEMCWIERPAVLQWFKDKAPELELNDRAPIWAVITVDVYFATLMFRMAEHRSALDVLDLVRQDLDLQLAVVGAYRMKAAAFEIMDCILNWKKETTDE